MKYKKLQSISGYSLFELVAVIVIVGIIAAVSMRTMRKTVELVKTEETKKELDQLAIAICGNPNLISGEVRLDFGYIGDNGTMPPNLDALVSNPGISTWDGPYLRDDFFADISGAGSEFKTDAWGQEYAYSGATITSTGGGFTIARKLANSVDELLDNSVSVLVTDINFTPPGSNNTSVLINLTYPNGSGLTTAATSPTASGFAQFDNIPMGYHPLDVINTVTSDTVHRTAVIYPGRSYYAEIVFFEEYW